MSKYHALVLRASGERATKTPANKIAFSLEELQAVVGGHIEIAELSSGEWMVLNEEGKLLGLPYNHEATNRFMDGGRLWFDPICGDVLICSYEQLEGDGSPEDADRYENEG